MAKPDRQPVQVQRETLERLRAFSDATGIPMARAVDDALRAYLDTTGKQLMATLKPKR